MFVIVGCGVALLLLAALDPARDRVEKKRNPHLHRFFGPPCRNVPCFAAHFEHVALLAHEDRSSIRCAADSVGGATTPASAVVTRASAVRNALAAASTPAATTRRSTAASRLATASRGLAMMASSAAPGERGQYYAERWQALRQPSASRLPGPAQSGNPGGGSAYCTFGCNCLIQIGCQNVKFCSSKKKQLKKAAT